MKKKIDKNWKRITIIVSVIYFIPFFILSSIFIWQFLASSFNRDLNISINIKENNYDFSNSCQCASRWDVKREGNTYTTILEFSEFYRYDLPTGPIEYVKTYHHRNPDSLFIGDILKNFVGKQVQIHVKGYTNDILYSPLVDGYFWISV